MQKSDVPTSKTKKADLLKFCEEHGLPDDLIKKATRPVLWKHVQNLLKENPQFEIDDLCAKKGVQLLRLPPWHPDLNPIEMIWSLLKEKVRKRNNSVKPKEVLLLAKQAYAEISPEDWSKRVQHTIRVENHFAKVALINTKSFFSFNSLFFL